MIRTFDSPVCALKCAYIGRESGGFSERFTADSIAKGNLSRLRGMFGSTSATLTLAENGIDVRDVGPGSAEVPCDVLVTTEYRHALLLRPADCLPLVLYSIHKPLLALVHCSRAGLDSGIIEHALSHLAKKPGGSPEHLRAYLAPGIRHASYALPPDEKTGHPAWRGNSRKADGHVYLDLFGFARDELMRLGISKDRISQSRIDTATHPGYYSHYRATRKNETNGRNGFIAVMLPPRK